MDKSADGAWFAPKHFGFGARRVALAVEPQRLKSFLSRHGTSDTGFTRS